MAKQIVIATHALLAKGFKESLNFIFKPEDEIHTICAFTEAPDPGAAFETLLSTFLPNDTVVVLTDLMGGSVNKAIAEKLRMHNFFLISGINLPVLLEISSCDEKDLSENFIRTTIDACRCGIVFMNDKVKETMAQKSEESFF